ncbi:MAG: hypothetical protein GX605_09810 [Chloroflexi bacterium]|nr:hypothetical protein [Chloroflexota bacterium]
MDAEAKASRYALKRLDSCPYLGKVDDASASYAQPTRRHRCYRWDRPLMVRREDQRVYCLTAAHAQCPRLSDPAALPVPGASPWGKPRRSGRSRSHGDPWSIRGRSRSELVFQFGPIVLLIVAAVLLTWAIALGGLGTPQPTVVVSVTSEPEAADRAAATLPQEMEPAGSTAAAEESPTATTTPTETAETPTETATSAPPTETATATATLDQAAFTSPPLEPSPALTTTATVTPTLLTPPPLPQMDPPTPWGTATEPPTAAPTTPPPTATWAPTATLLPWQSPLATPTPGPPTATPSTGPAGGTPGAPTVTPTRTPTATRTPYRTPTRTPSPPPGTPYWNYVVTEDHLTLEWQGQDTCAKVWGTVTDQDGNLLTHKDGIAVHLVWWWEETWVGKPGFPSFHSDGTYEFCLNRGQFTMNIVDLNDNKQTSQAWWFDVDIRNFTGRPIYQINWKRVR